MTDTALRAAVVAGLAAVLTGAGALWQVLRLPLEGPASPAPARAAAEGAGAERHAPIAFDPSVAARDLFRPGRAPPPVPFDPLVPDDGPRPQPERPQVVLVGVVLGHPSSALLRGVGGSPIAVLLTEREERDGTRLLRVAAGHVTIALGRDTVTLALSKEGG